MKKSELSTKRVLDEVCDAFEAGWSPEQLLNVDQYVGQVEKDLRDRLLKMLLEVDAELRKKAGLPVSADLYSEFGESAIAFLKNESTGLGDDTDVEQPTIAGPPRLSTKESATSSPSKLRRIGPYKLLQQIGEGGMGSVWMAEQEEPVRRRVALKLIRGDMGSRETIARFEAERQALAMMDHQNIAKVLDAGTTDDGTPFFVMELVRGIPITQFCDDSRLSIRERLKLFVPVCKAVQHAHQKGIVHRDLKPSNVLVTLYDGEAVPKVIDFGLAKALDHTTKLTDKTVFTEFGKVVGTLQYMSPEQAETNALDVDTRTDIYSLGVMLYELLTGSTPLDKKTLGHNALLQVLALIKESEPPRPSHRLSTSVDTINGISEQRKIAPSKLQQVLKGELDWVVMKALAKDRGRRYDTAGGFADDVCRFLANEPVLARPASTVYRLGKMIQKNQGMAISIGLIFLSIIGGVVFSAWYAIEAKVARDEALKQQAIADKNAVKFQQAAGEATANLAEAEKQKQLAVNSLVTALTVAPENLLDDSLQALEPFEEDLIQVLESRFEAASGTQKLHLGLALNHFDQSPDSFLVQALISADDKYFRRSLNALAKNPQENLTRVRLEINRLAGDRASSDASIRLSIAALQLGDTGPARKLLARDDDPTPRTEFVAQLPRCVTQISPLIDAVQEEPDSDFLYSLILGIGNIPASRSRQFIDSEDRKRLVTSLRSFVASHPDNGVASASSWTLSRLGEQSEGPSELVSRYITDTAGIKMLRLDSGSLLHCEVGERAELKGISPDTTNKRKQQWSVARPFFLSATEVTNKQWIQFEKANPELFKLTGSAPTQSAGTNEPQLRNASQQGNSASNRSQVERVENLPAGKISWTLAIQFCNWLSEQEKLTVCYKRDQQGQWIRVADANGYRLPSEAEWELACRAGSETDYFIGDTNGLDNLKLFAQFDRSVAKVGEKMPNRFGLFDMIGNHAEWCHEYTGPRDSTSRIRNEIANSISNLDSKKKVSNSPYVLRGGDVRSFVEELRSSSRRFSGVRFLHGFRIARSILE